MKKLTKKRNDKKFFSNSLSVFFYYFDDDKLLNRKFSFSQSIVSPIRKLISNETEIYIDSFNYLVSFSFFLCLLQSCIHGRKSKNSHRKI